MPTGSTATCRQLHGANDGVSVGLSRDLAAWGFPLRGWGSVVLPHEGLFAQVKFFAQLLQLALLA
jgi:hypothetical protein